MQNYNKLITSLFVCGIMMASVMILPLNSAKDLQSPMQTDNENAYLSKATLIVESTLRSFGKHETHKPQPPQLMYDSKEENVLAYLFKFEPTGFIIVSHLPQLPSVLAYSFINDANSTQEPYDVFIEFIKKDITSRLSYQSSSTTKKPKHITPLWKQNTEPYQLYTLKKPDQQWPPEGSTKTNGWIETTWHQNKPYKNFCPMDYTTNKRSIAGCPSIAMAQILNYHQSINSISFSDHDDYVHEFKETYIIDDDFDSYDFPSFPQLNHYLHQLTQRFDQQQPLTDDDKAALTFACGVAAKQVYSSSVSGTYGVDQAFQAYQKFNCTDARLLQNDTQSLYNEVIEDIKQAQPVHLAVVDSTWQTGHNLIIDGYNTNGYFHLNFGFGGQYDGWYEIPDEIPFQLTILEGVIVDIMDHAKQADLSADGSIQLPAVKTGSTINESFTVINNGTPGSTLDWYIDEIPSWGTWNINPLNQSGLTPEDGPTTIRVNLTAPEKKWRTYNGGITIVNANQPGDKTIVPVSIQTTKNKRYDSSFPSVITQYPFLERLYHLLNEKIFM